MLPNRLQMHSPLSLAARRLMHSLLHAPLRLLTQPLLCGGLLWIAFGASAHAQFSYELPTPNTVFVQESNGGAIVTLPAMTYPDPEGFPGFEYSYGISDSPPEFAGTIDDFVFRNLLEFDPATREFDFSLPPSRTDFVTTDSNGVDFISKRAFPFTYTIYATNREYRDDVVDEECVWQISEDRNRVNALRNCPNVFELVILQTPVIDVPVNTTYHYVAGFEVSDRMPRMRYGTQSDRYNPHADLKINYGLTPIAGLNNVNLLSVLNNNPRLGEMRLQGTPSVGSGFVAYSAVDSAGSYADRIVRVQVHASPILPTIAQKSIPTGERTALNLPGVQSGGVGPFSYQLSGAPDDFELHTAGAIGNWGITAPRVGTYEMTWTVADYGVDGLAGIDEDSADAGEVPRVSQVFTLAVTPDSTPVPKWDIEDGTPLIFVQDNTAFHELTPVGGLAPMSFWSVPTLQSGLTHNTNGTSMRIDGSASAALVGGATYTLNVEDSNGKSDGVDVHIEVTPIPAFAQSQYAVTFTQGVAANYTMPGIVAGADDFLAYRYQDAAITRLSAAGFLAPDARIAPYVVSMTADAALTAGIAETFSGDYPNVSGHSATATTTFVVVPAPTFALSEYSLSFTTGAVNTFDMPLVEGYFIDHDSDLGDYTGDKQLGAGLSLLLDGTARGRLASDDTILPGAFTFSYRANYLGGVLETSILVHIAEPPVFAAPPDALTYVVGRWTAQTLQAVRGAAPLRYSIAPSLSNGLALETVQGIIYGRPGAVASGEYTYTATDANGATGAHILTIEVQTAPAPFAQDYYDYEFTEGQVSAFDLPILPTADAYETDLALYNGVGEIAQGFSVAAGQLPAQLMSNREIQSAQRFTFTLFGLNLDGEVLDDTEIAVVVQPPVSIDGLPENVVTAIDYTNPTVSFTRVGGVWPYTYSITPELPGGLVLAERIQIRRFFLPGGGIGSTTFSHGRLDGKPYELSPDRRYIMQVTEGNGGVTTQTFNLEVLPRPVFGKSDYYYTFTAGTVSEFTLPTAAVGALERALYSLHSTARVGVLVDMKINHSQQLDSAPKRPPYLISNSLDSPVSQATVNFYMYYAAKDFLPRYAFTGSRLHIAIVEPPKLLVDINFSRVATYTVGSRIKRALATITGGAGALSFAFTRSDGKPLNGIEFLITNKQNSPLFPVGLPAFELHADVTTEDSGEYVLTATDANGVTDRLDFHYTFLAPPRFADNLPSEHIFAVNSAADYQLPKAEDGYQVRYLFFGDLPSGLTYSEDDAADIYKIAGTPDTVTAVAPVTFIAYDNGGAATYTLNVGAAAKPSFSQSNWFADYSQGASSYTIGGVRSDAALTLPLAVGDNLTYSTLGALPSGLIAQSAGDDLIITGTPSVTGEFIYQRIAAGAAGADTFTMNVRVFGIDFAPTQDKIHYTLAGGARTVQLATASGGVGYLAYSVSPALDLYHLGAVAALDADNAALSLDLDSGLSGERTYTVTVTDRHGARADSELLIEFYAPLAFAAANPTSPVTFTSDFLMTFAYSALSGGRMPYQYSLPIDRNTIGNGYDNRPTFGGLIFDATNRLLYGKTAGTQIGRFADVVRMTYTATDANGAALTHVAIYNAVFHPRFYHNAPYDPDAVYAYDAAYTFRVSAPVDNYELRGLPYAGVAPYSIKFTEGINTAPADAEYIIPGLVMDLGPSRGLYKHYPRLNGIPTRAADEAVTVQYTDFNGASVSINATFTILPPPILPPIADLNLPAGQQNLAIQFPPGENLLGAGDAGVVSYNLINVDDGAAATLPTGIVFDVDSRELLGSAPAAVAAAVTYIYTVTDQFADITATVGSTTVGQTFSIAVVNKAAYPSTGADVTYVVGSASHLSDDVISSDAITLPAVSGAVGTVVYTTPGVPDGMLVSTIGEQLLLSGAPTTGGVTSFLRIADDDGVTGGQTTYTLNIFVFESPSYDGTALPNLRATLGGRRAVQMPTPNGGSGGFSYSISPPDDGLLLNPETGILLITTEQGEVRTDRFTLTATGRLGGTVSALFSITYNERMFFVGDNPPKQYFTNTGRKPTTFTTAGGGAGPPYEYAMDFGPRAVFNGLSFDGASRVLHGSFTRTGQYYIPYVATDSVGGRAVFTFDVFSNGAPLFSGASLSQLSQGYTFSMAQYAEFTLPTVRDNAQGYGEKTYKLTIGDPQYTHRISQSDRETAYNDPEFDIHGVTLDAPSRLLSGTPTVPGVYRLNYNARDANGVIISAQANVFVLGDFASPMYTLRYTTGSASVKDLPQLPGSIAYSADIQSLIASGQPGEGFALDLTGLPARLSANASVREGAFTFTLGAIATNGEVVASTEIEVLITAPITIEEAGRVLYSGQGDNFTADLAVNGGAAPYAVGVTPPLPSGMSVSVVDDPGTRMRIQGAPTQLSDVAAYSFRITDVNNAVGETIVSFAAVETPRFANIFPAFTFTAGTSTAHTLPTAVGDDGVLVYTADAAAAETLRMGGLLIADTAQFAHPPVVRADADTIARALKTLPYGAHYPGLSSRIGEATAFIYVAAAPVVASDNLSFTANIVTTFDLTASGGAGDLLHSLRFVDSRALPRTWVFDHNELHIRSANTIMPSDGGRLVWRAVDSNGATASVTFDLVVTERLHFAAATPLDHAFARNVATQYDLPRAVGGVDATYALSGDLPDGLIFESNVANRLYRITGTPSQTDTGKRLTYVATDRNGASVSVVLTFRVTDKPSFTPSNVAVTYTVNNAASSSGGTNNVNALILPAAVGASGAASYSSSGSLPTGLVVTETSDGLAAISGAPTQSGDFVYLRIVTDAANRVDTFSAHLHVATAPMFGAQPTVHHTIGGRNIVELTRAEGGFGALSYWFTAPPDANHSGAITLDSADAVLTLALTAGADGDFTFILNAADGHGASASGLTPMHFYAPLDFAAGNPPAALTFGGGVVQFAHAAFGRAPYQYALPLDMSLTDADNNPLLSDFVFDSGARQLSGMFRSAAKLPAST